MTVSVLDRLLTTLDVRLHAFAVCEIEAGWRLAFEPMSGVTIHYVLAGHGVVRIEGGLSAPYSPFSIIVVPAGVSQSLGDVNAGLGEAGAADNCGPAADGLVKFTAGTGGATRVVCATITASYSGALGLFEKFHAPAVVDIAESVSLRALFDVMLAEIATPAIGSRALTEALMKQCLILMLRQQLVRFGPQSPFFVALQDERLARVITGIVERPADPHTVESLAALAGMSRSTFAARFAATFGETPIEFVHRVRLRLGAHLLRTTDLPIKVIAASVGYASRSYFTRAFRSMHGADPRGFRVKTVEAERITYEASEPSVGERILDAVGDLLVGRQ